MDGLIFSKTASNWGFVLFVALCGCPAPSGNGGGDSAVDTQGKECSTRGDDCRTTAGGTTTTGGTTTIGGMTTVSAEDTDYDGCPSGGGDDECCPGASWCEDEDGTSPDPDPLLSCECFDIRSTEVVISCWPPEPCGTVELPEVEEPAGSTGGADLDPALNAANLEVMGCLIDSLDAGQSVLLTAVTGPGAQYQYRRNVATRASLGGFVWDHAFENLTETLSPVVDKVDLAGIVDCADMTDSVAQWGCINDAIDAARTSETCTDEVVVEGK